MRTLFTFLAVLLLSAQSAHAQCSNPPGVTADMIFNTTYNVPTYCDGTNWIAMKGGQNETTDPALSNGLVAHWKLDETAGPTAVDSSAFGNNGTYTLAGGGFNQAGVIATAILVATSEYIEVPYDASYSENDQMTVTAWVYRTAGSTGNIVFQGDGFEVSSATANHRVVFNAGRWDTSNGRWRTANDALKAGVWNFIAITYDYGSTTNDPLLYVNGVAVAFTNETNTPAGTVEAANESLYIGNTRPDLQNSGSNWNKPQDEIRIYNRILTPAEVQEIYNARDGIHYNATERVPEFFDGNRFVAMTPDFPDVTNGLVGHWKLDETSGTTAVDTTGGANGTMQASMTADSKSTAGAISTSFAFNGIDDRISMGDIFDFGTNQNFTLSAWIKMDQGAGGGTILSKRLTNVGWWIGVNAANGNADSNLDDNVVPGIRADYTGDLRDNTWHLITATYDRAGDMNLYVDGVLADTEDITAASATVSSANSVIIGSNNSNTSPFMGAIDDARVYNRELTAAEIQTLYNMGTPAGSVTALPQGCPNIGDVCDDGTIYAGLSPDGNVAMFMTTIDYEGAGLSWNNDTGNFITTAALSDTDGDGNTLALVQTVGVSAPYNAANYCFDQVAHGLDDWYLPAQNELNLVYNGGSPLADIKTGGQLYWTSTERSGANTQAKSKDMTVSFFGNTGKSGNNRVRCVRKGPAPRCANPYGREGNIVYNTNGDVAQYCDGARWVAIGKTAP